MSETTEAAADATGSSTRSAAGNSAPDRRNGLFPVIGGLGRSTRPRQWVKNVLVFAAPFTAGEITDGSVLVAGLLAFAAFVLAASAVYLVNDVVDVEADRAHPTKCQRPIAAGVVPRSVALAATIVLFAGGVTVGYLADWRLAMVLVVYAAVQLGYCYGLKHQPVVDLAIVASGFLLRAVGGGVAAGIVLSQWFLLVTAFGSLFMVAGKRYAEIMLVQRTGADIRSSLRKYSASYLRFVWATSSAIMIMSYALWAFGLQQHSDQSVWAVVSIVPFVVAVLRYAVDVDAGNAGEPEVIALRDRVLQVLGAGWVVSLALSFYL